MKYLAKKMFITILVEIPVPMDEIVYLDFLISFFFFTCSQNIIKPAENGKKSTYSLLW